MKGIGVSQGIAMGVAELVKNIEPKISGIKISTNEIDIEILKFEKAVTLSIKQIHSLQNKKNNLTETEQMILDTQIEFLNDPQLKEKVSQQIKTHLKNVNDALLETINELVLMFQQMDSHYMKERATDIKDIGYRIIKNLSSTLHNIKNNDTLTNTKKILIAKDLNTSDTLALDLKTIAGFVTQFGSQTSHTAILAKSKGIPAILGCGKQIENIKNGDLIIIDGKEGLVLINPNSERIAEYKQKESEFAQLKLNLKLLKNKEAITIDEEKINLLANISIPEELDDMFLNGGIGVGLLRTEMLFLSQQHLPSEEQQFEFYKKIAIKSKHRPITIRTIDIGGDKQLPYFGIKNEQNPFLGYRAIRVCLENEDIFITQLKAILRASAFGNFKIMFPMISNIDEVRQAKNIVEKAKQHLITSHIDFDKNIPIGIMIEIPSAAIMADMLAKEVDFFSIGTNDLCQYTLAVDRMNEKISHLYNPFDIAVLRLIKNVIDQGHKNNINVSMCGELAGDPNATKLLLAMGLRDFSLSAHLIPQLKNIILNTNIKTIASMWNKIKNLDSSISIFNYIK